MAKTQPIETVPEVVKVEKVKELTRDEELFQKIEELKKELDTMKSNQKAEMPTDTDRAYEDAAQSVKRQCEEGNMVDITIPYNESNPSDQIVEVWLSGYKWQIPRGETIKVPKDIADIYHESYRKTIEATNKIKMNIKKPDVEA